MDAEQLQRIRPFAGIVELTAVEPLQAQGSLSGSAFWASSRDGRSYKLRVCRTAWRARNIARYLEILGEGAPALLAREGRLLLLERLDGYRPIERLELLGRARQLGRMAARVHRDARAAGLPGAPAGAAVAAATRLQFARDLRRLRSAGLVDATTARTAHAKLRRRLRDRGLPVALEMDDLHKANFLLREVGEAGDPDASDLRYVDEQGLALRPQGMGLASLLKTATRSRSWQAYCDGYAELAPAPMREPEVVELLLLIDAVRRAARKHREATRLQKLPTEVEAVRAIASSGAVSLQWCFPSGY